MLIVQEKLVSDDVVSAQFVCNLSKCKGACCWEGDLGAPLDDVELPILDKIYEKVRPFLPEDAQAKIDTEGGYVFYDEVKQYGTNLLPDGRCVYLSFDELNIAKCGIEKAYEAGAIDWKKPISCHLYPIRVDKNEELGFEALNYDIWSICSDACALGAELKVPVYQFLKEAIERKYGKDFYEELDALAQYEASRKDTLK